MITCQAHGSQVGYIICEHVLKGEPCAHRMEPGQASDDVDLGEVLCEACVQQYANHRDDEHDADTLYRTMSVICAQCLAKAIKTAHVH